MSELEKVLVCMQKKIDELTEKLKQEKARGDEYKNKFNNASYTLRNLRNKLSKGDHETTRSMIMDTLTEVNYCTSKRHDHGIIMSIAVKLVELEGWWIDQKSKSVQEIIGEMVKMIDTDYYFKSTHKYRN